MKNFLYFTTAEAAQAFLIIHEHYHTTQYDGKVYVSCWNTTLNDSLDIALHPDDVKHYAQELWLRWGRDCHVGNLAERLGCPVSNCDELHGLFRAGLIEELPKGTPETDTF